MVHYEHDNFYTFKNKYLSWCMSKFPSKSRTTENLYSAGLYSVLDFKSNLDTIATTFFHFFLNCGYYVTNFMK